MADIDHFDAEYPSVHQSRPNKELSDTRLLERLPREIAAVNAKETVTNILPTTARSYDSFKLNVCDVAQVSPQHKRDHDTKEAKARRNPALKESSRYSLQAEKAFSEIDAKVTAIFQEVRSWRGWQLVSDPTADPAMFRAVMREIFYAVHLYQADTTEAGFRMIGRLPKTEVKLIQVLTHHKAEEAEHGVWAFEDYLALGGNPDKAERRPQTPATFAVAGLWWWMAETADPFGYLGAEYLFENLTERVTKEIVQMLAQRKLPGDGLRFIVEHATEDEKHSNLFRHLLKDTLTRFPHSAQAMLRCFDYFAQVYPIPVWDEAFVRAAK